MIRTKYETKTSIIKSTLIAVFFVIYENSFTGKI